MELAHISVATNHVDVPRMCFDHELLSYFGFVQIRIYLITVCSGVSVTPPDQIETHHTAKVTFIQQSWGTGALILESHYCNCVPLL